MGAAVGPLPVRSPRLACAPPVPRPTCAPRAVLPALCPTSHCAPPRAVPHLALCSPRCAPPRTVLPALCPASSVLPAMCCSPLSSPAASASLRQDRHRAREEHGKQRWGELVTSGKWQQLRPTRFCRSFGSRGPWVPPFFKLPDEQLLPPVLCVQLCGRPRDLRGPMLEGLPATVNDLRHPAPHSQLLRALRVTPRPSAAWRPRTSSALTQRSTAPRRGGPRPPCRPALRGSTLPLPRSGGLMRVTFAARKSSKC